jgi:hypothetical protein
LFVLQNRRFSSTADTDHPVQALLAARADCWSTSIVAMGRDPDFEPAGRFLPSPSKIRTRMLAAHKLCGTLRATPRTTLRGATLGSPPQAFPSHARLLCPWIFRVRAVVR